MRQMRKHAPVLPVGSMFTIPISNRYFEDYVEGSVHEFGSIGVEEQEVVAFACRFDPQNFHTDPEKAKETIFGGLIASGWHIASLATRLYVDYYLSSVASLGSPGVDELRWTKPVRPGDKLSIRVTILEANVSRSRPDRGIICSRVEVINQNREVVMYMKIVNFLLRREMR
jgi:acyl dehydratase